jgi:Ni2+-binding GTPase involved in maturation of urease and hydrogenase
LQRISGFNCCCCCCCRYKLRPPRGLLLHGPPGSGKTALARAAAVEARAALLVVNGPDILTEFYGEAELCMLGFVTCTDCKHVMDSCIAGCEWA